MQARATTWLVAVVAGCGPSAADGSTDASTTDATSEASGPSSGSAAAEESTSSGGGAPPEYSARYLEHELTSNSQGLLGRFDPARGYCVRISVETESILEPTPDVFPGVLTNDDWHVTEIFVNAPADSCFEDAYDPSERADALDAEGSIDWRPHPDCRVTASVTVTLPESDDWPAQVVFDVTDLPSSTPERLIPCATE